MTIEELAQKLGVSKSTVSRALSGKGRISEETRMKIQACARQAGMWPKQQETAHSTQNLGVILPTAGYTMSIPFFEECLLGISEAASSLQYQVMVEPGGAEELSGIRRLVDSGKVDAIILMQNTKSDVRLKYLSELPFPVGLIGSCGYPGVIQVDSDSRAAAESLTMMLVGRGYRRFALITTVNAYGVNSARCRGVSGALERCGMEKGLQIFRASLMDMERMEGIIRSIFSSRADCIICADDLICARLMSRLLGEGYRIPRDIAVASLCNSPTLDYFSPAVTAVNITGRKLGNAIGTQMIRFLQGEEYEEKMMLDYEILFRKSTNRKEQL